MTNEHKPTGRVFRPSTEHEYNAHVIRSIDTEDQVHADVYNDIYGKLINNTHCVHTALQAHEGNTTAQVHNIGGQIEAAVNNAEERVKSELEPKWYQHIAENDSCYYTLFPDGTIVGGGRVARFTSYRDVSFPSCEKFVDTLWVSANRVENRNIGAGAVNVLITNLGTMQPRIRISDANLASSLRQKEVYYTFYGRVKMS